MAFISNGTTVATGGSLQNVPAPTTSQVGTSTSGLSADAVGSYAMLGARSNQSSSNQKDFGQTLSGSSLEPRSAGGYQSDENNRSGTWRCMGHKAAFNNDLTNSTTLWLRIS
jgi:hypothetical protein